MKTKIVGVSFGDNQKIVSGLNEGELLTLAREYNNEHDKNAIAVLRSDGKKFGYISREIAYDMAPAMDNGAEYVCGVKEITGLDKDTKGVNVEITRSK